MKSWLSTVWTFSAFCYPQDSFSAFRYQSWTMAMVGNDLSFIKPWRSHRGGDKCTGSGCWRHTPNIRKGRRHGMCGCFLGWKGAGRVWRGAFFWCKFGVKIFDFRWKHWKHFDYWRNSKTGLPAEIKGKTRSINELAKSAGAYSTPPASTTRKLINFKGLSCQDKPFLCFCA